MGFVQTGGKMTETVLYALSTCMWCKKTKALLDEQAVDYKCIFVNELEGEERDKILEEVTQFNKSRSFPTLIINGKVIVGFKPDDIKAAIAEMG